MSSSRLRRLATVVSTAMLGALVLGTGTAFASTPGWSFRDQTLIPDRVSPGAAAGYSFTIHNGGKSNIAQIFLTADTTQPVVYLHTDRSTAVCSTTPSLNCAFGALISGADIHVTVAYTTPSSGTSFSPTFFLSATGNTGSDGGTSHGDYLPYTFTTALDASPNFAGGFQVAGGTFSTNATLGKKNLQATSVSSNLSVVPVNVTDGITAFPGTGTDPCATLTCVGDWTRVSVGNGTTDGPVEIKLLIYGQSVKGNPSLSDFAVWHDGTIINTPCSSTTLPAAGGAECITVTMQGTNYLLDLWLNHNGTLRGLS